MTRIVASLAEISAGYQVLFCDLWGCVHNGQTAYPAAVAALRQFRAAGGIVVLMTNAPRPHPDILPGLARLGVPDAAWDMVVSSGDAAQQALFAGAVGRTVWHLGPAKDDGLFAPPPGAGEIARVPLELAEGMVCTGPFDELTETPEDYRPRLQAARDRGLALLCANPDLVVDMGERRIYCAGALAALYDQMGGKSLYFGKPHPPIYALALHRLATERGLDIARDRILAVGDGIGTDILGGQSQGIATLFVTGGLAADRFGPDPESPDPAQLRAWLDDQPARPEYAIGRLR